MVRMGISFAAALALTVGAACAHGDATPATRERPAESAAGAQAAQPAEARAVVRLEGRSGAQVTGQGSFTARPDGEVVFEARFENAPPGIHAVHLHEFGDCSADDASSAGGHWNPTGQQHGKWGGGEFHLGDIGNLEIGPDGRGQVELRTDLWTVGGGAENDVVGKALIMHVGPDDYRPPVGHAGGRIACGVVTLEGEPLSDR